ncbi:MAG: helix-turn-helix transcriptional regulator [Tabrizicola sp.]|nr:helix-turn-helix transcriptional regulator [Tabrizicola sp.]
MLRQRRKALNLTLAQVAERIGIATGFLSGRARSGLGFGGHADPAI